MTTPTEFAAALRDAGADIVRAHEDARARQRVAFREAGRAVALTRRREVLALAQAHHEALQAFEQGPSWRGELDARIGRCPRCLGHTWDGHCRGNCHVSTGEVTP